METLALKDYLFEVLGRETALITAKYVNNEIEKNIRETTDAHKFVKIPDVPQKHEPKFDRGEIIKALLGLRGLAIGWVIGSIVLVVISILGWIDAVRVILPIFTIICVAIPVGMIIKSFCEYLSKKNDSEKVFIDAYEKYQEDKEEAELQVEIIKNNQHVIISELNKRKAQNNSLISKTQKVLNELYNFNIIFPKYRGNIVPIANFCEYIGSGRCNSLEGHEGAYDIYENEVRLDRIIERIDVVIKSLDKIGETQCVLYNAITESNRMSRAIAHEIRGLDADMGKPSTSGTAAEFYSKEAAINQKILENIADGEPK
ncbi:MAG: hypothetical protein FWE27_01190 [Defluviitaleaceae bacterium]|nr:hypothetical protein [Defluviitaleaceae bacterium]